MLAYFEVEGFLWIFVAMFMCNSRIKINGEEKIEYSDYDELISKILIY